jgi:hypothetical protein
MPHSSEISKKKFVTNETFADLKRLLIDSAGNRSEQSE